MKIENQKSKIENRKIENKKSKIKNCLGGIMLAAVTGCGTQAPQPNIIFIMVDDMGFGDLGCYGGNIEPTPQIDRMAIEGIRFTQYYSASPISSPSRTGMLTGQYPAMWHITSYLQTRAGNKNAQMRDYLDPDAPSIARALQAGGYKTAHIGKWHMGGGRDVHNAPSITKYGYDEYVSTYESPDPDPLLTATDWIWSNVDSINRWDRTAYFVDKTLDFLKRNKGTPTFVNLWPDDVHTPWIGSEEEMERFPQGQNSERHFRTVLIEFDRQMGRLMDGLIELGIAENTLIVFTNDNGPAPDFQGKRNGGFRGNKASLWEGGIRVPFIVWCGGKVIPRQKAGTVDETTVISAFDMFASLCRIARVQMPKDYVTAGEDLSKAMLGKPQKRKNPIFWEYRRNDSGAFPQPADRDRSPNLAVREGDWKLLVNADGTDAELYNLKNDPAEKNPLNEHPEIKDKLTKKALEWRSSFPEFTE